MGEDKTKVYRHELKFLINQYHYMVLRERLKYIFKTDANATKNEYHVRSLYFDDMFKSAYRTKGDGVLDRKKLRIRIYDFKDDLIKLEKKEKHDQFVCKTVQTIDKEMVNKIIKGNMYDYQIKGQTLLDEWVFRMRNQDLRPSVIVDYNRETFIMEPGNVRITFDKNLCAVDCQQDIFQRDVVSKPVLDPKLMIMEIKYTDFLPSIVKEVMQVGSLERTAISKYTMCIDKLKAGGYVNV